jgi:hypothetical protein
MKITLNPIASLLARAEQRVKVHYFPDSLDLVHDRKRALAESVLAGIAPTQEFIEAAVIEGLSPQALAAVIVAKPDAMMARENARRAVVVKLRQVTTSADLDRILVEEGVPLTNMISDFFPG